MQWLSLAVLVVSLTAINPYVRGDGNGYYAWLVSPVIDHDLDFRNQYARAEPLFHDRYLDDRDQARPERLTPAGRLEDQWSVGPALLWTPWFLVAHGGVSLARWSGSAVAADGYSWPYRWACAIGTVCYGWIGVMLARRAALQLGVSARVATVATAAVWAAGSLPVYQYFLPFHVHALAAFSVSLFLWYWIDRRPLGTTRAWAVWGLAAGLMTVVYQLNAVVLVVVPIALYEMRVAKPRASIWAALAAGAGGALVLWIPQLAGKAFVYGTPFTTGYRDQFFWMTPHLIETAWSADHGLFLWTPIALAGVLGLFALPRRQAASFIAIFTVFFYVVASFENWHGVSSFGNRFFVSLTVVLVIGVGALIERLRRWAAWSASAAMAPCVLLACWNAGLAFQWGTKMLPNRGPVDLRVAAVQQFTVVPRRAAGAAWKYFSDRAGFVHAIEQQDEHEWRAQREDR